MFTELLGNDFFRAGSLVTKWPQEVVWTEANYDHLVPSSILDKAEGGHFTNLIVAKGGAPIGYVPVHVVRKTVVLRERSVKPCQRISHLVDLPHLVARFRIDGTRRYPIYTVEDDEHEVIGIMNYTDLNRKSVYMYSYTLLLFLEHWLKNVVKSHGEPTTLRLLTNQPSRNPKHAHRFGEIEAIAKGRGMPEFSVCDLRDLVYVVQNNTKLLQHTSGLTSASMDFAWRFLRNRVAHPNNLLVSSRKSSERLADLHDFFSEMISFIGRHDYNDKNRIYS